MRRYSSASIASDDMSPDSVSNVYSELSTVSRTSRLGCWAGAGEYLEGRYFARQHGDGSTSEICTLARTGSREYLSPAWPH